MLGQGVARMRSVVDNNPMPTVVVDAAVVVVVANAAACDLFGDTIEGRPLGDLLGVPTVWAGHLASFRAAPGAEHAPRARLDVALAGGRRTVTLSGLLLPDQAHRVVVISDVTSEAVCARERDHLRALFSGIDQGFALNEVVRDAVGVPVDYRFIEVNPAFIKQTGLPDDCVGKTVREVLGAAVAPAWIEAMCRVATEGVSLAVERTSEELGRAFEVHAFPVGAERFGTLVKDVTARRQDELARIQAQRLESLGALVGGIAHDFNNLFTAVIGNLDLARLALGDDVEVGRRLRNMESGLLRAQDLVRPLLAYSGRAHTARRDLDVSTLVRSVAELLRVSVSRQVELELDLSSHLPQVDADESQLQHLLVNLVVNASEAYGDAPGKVVLRTSVEPVKAADNDLLSQGLVPAPHVVIEVVDSGAGMSVDVQRRMFEPFFSTKGLGRGLGLAAIGGIVRGHNGAIRVRSSPGRGARIAVFLPARPGAVVAHGVPAPTPPIGGGAALIVDDEPMVRSTVAAMVQALGLHPDVASSGEEAVEMVASAPDHYRVVLLDLVMPGEGGAAALRRIREIAPGLPVLVCSGYHDAGALAGVSLDEVPFLPKPFQLAALRSALTRLLHT